MKERSFDEMIAYFNRRVSEMDIAQDYKMELFGMVMALGFKHEKSAQPEIIRCKDCIHNTLPRESGNAMCELYYGMIEPWGFCHRGGRR